MYVKLFNSIWDGSMRGHSDLILVFVNLLCHADRDGIVDRTCKTIADETGLSLRRVEAAVVELEGADKDSRSRNDDGRRLERIDPERAWGWQVVNFKKYDSLRNSEERREYMRKLMADKRKQKVLALVSTVLAPVSNVSLPSASASASASAGGGGEPPPPGILELVAKVKNCRPEYKNLNQMALENAFKGIPPTDAQKAVTDFCRNEANKLQATNDPIRLLAGYLRKAFDGPGSQPKYKTRF